MKTRRSVFDLLVTVFSALALLSIFVFMVLVPEGKAYNALANEVQKKDAELSKLQMQFDQRYDHHSILQDEYRQAMKAVERSFNQAEFIEKYVGVVTALKVKMQKTRYSNGLYVIKDIDVAVRFESPKIFYTLMEQINHSDWIIAVKAPITFEGIGDEINATFSMNVYALN